MKQTESVRAGAPIELVRAGAQTECVQAGALILRQGMPGDTAYKIKCGRVEVFRRNDEGQDIRLSEFGPGEMIGEATALFGGPCYASVRALTETELVPVPRRTLQESIKRSPTMRAHIMDLIAQRTVRNICLFSDLTDAEKAQLPQGNGPHLYGDKAIIFSEGDPMTDIYVVCSGLVQDFRRTPDGDEITVDVLKPGDLFCKTALLLNEGRHYSSARALSSAYIVKVPVSQFRDVVRGHSVVAERLLTRMARIAQLKQLELERQATLTAPQLLAEFLKSVCATHDLDPAGFELPYRKSVIASRLGMKLETLSRAWPKLREYGIHVRGSRVVIQDTR